MKTLPSPVSSTNSAGHRPTRWRVLGTLLLGLAWLAAPGVQAQLVTNCCPPCPAPYPHSVTVTVLTGFNYLVNPLCHGTDNSVGTLLPNVPDGTTIWWWDPQNSTLSAPIDYYLGLGWADGMMQPADWMPLPPGEGFILLNPDPAYTLTFHGCEPICPRPCGPDGLRRLVGVVGPGPGAWTNLFACPPQCGTVLSKWNPLAQQFQDYTFGAGGWSPSEPTWPAGTSVFVSQQSQTNCCATPPAGMVAWWPLDEGTGAPVLQDLVAASHATVIPGPLGSSLAPVPFPGKVAGAVMFADTNGFGQVPSAPALNVAAANFSVDAWMFPVPCGQDYVHPIVDKLVPLDPLSGYAFYAENNQLRLALGDPVAGGQLYTCTLPLTLAAWNFVAVAVDFSAGTVVFHVNGASQTLTSPAPTPKLPNNAPLWIGGSRRYTPSPLPTPSPCEVALDEVEIFNRALSAADLAPIFLADRLGKCKPSLNCSNSVVTITCPPSTNILACASNAVVFYPAPQASTTCGVITNLTTVPPSGSVFPAGVTVVTATATDSQGNSAACVFTVTVLPDRTPPQCPPSPVVVTGCPALMPDFRTNGLVTDDCTPVGQISVVQNPPPGTPLLPGPNVVTLVVCDAMGNCRECDVFIQAQTGGAAPQITCPPDIVTTAYATCGFGKVVTYPPPVVVDGGLASCTPPPGSFFPFGTTTVTCVATNACGTNVCTFTVTVNYGGAIAPCVAPPANMVMWLQFDEASGTTALNSSAGNHGALANNPTRVTGQYVQHSLCFNGGNQYVQVNPYPAMQFGTGDFSVDAWVKPATTGPGPRFIVDHREHSGAVVRGYGVFLSTNNVLALQLADGTAANYYSALTVPANGQWHHIAVTVKRGDSQGIRFYVNGTPDPTGYNPTPRAGSITAGPCVPFRVACASASQTNLFPGCVDEVELFRRVLTPAEVKGLVDAQCKGKCRLTCHGHNHTLQRCDLGTSRPETLIVPNDLPYPVTVNWQLQAITGPGCTSGLASFSPASGTATIAANSSGVILPTITFSSNWQPGECACFRLVITTPDGSLRSECERRYCLAGGGGGPGGILDPVCCFPITPFSTARGLEPGEVTFSLEATGPTPPILSNLVAVLRSPENEVVAVTPLPQVALPPPPAGGAVPVTASFAFPNYDPGRIYRVALEADLAGTGQFLELGAIPVMNELPPTESEQPLTVRKAPGPGTGVIIVWPNPCAVIEVNPSLNDPTGWTPGPVQTSPWTFTPEPGAPALFLRLRQ